MVKRFLTLILFMTFTTGCTHSVPQTSIDIAIAGEQFVLELSTDMSSRVHGLMGRTSIPKHGGMIFVFTEAKERSFWMVNCLINIDIIFLDSRGTITAIHNMLSEPPQSEEESQWVYEERLKHYYSNGPARFAIELTEGSIQRLNLHVNDRIPLNLQELRNLAR
jgi:uncharacterized membrane protein (UPF0127 family)